MHTSNIKKINVFNSFPECSWLRKAVFPYPIPLYIYTKGQKNKILFLFGFVPEIGEVGGVSNSINRQCAGQGYIKINILLLDMLLDMCMLIHNRMCMMLECNCMYIVHDVISSDLSFNSFYSVSCTAHTWFCVSSVLNFFKMFRRNTYCTILDMLPVNMLTTHFDFLKFINFKINISKGVWMQPMSS